MLLHKIVKWIFYLILIQLFFSHSALAVPYFGINLSTSIVPGEPASLHAYQFSVNYDPNEIKWRKFNLYFDGGFSHVWIKHSAHTNLNIYSIAPVIRYSFKKRGAILPYLEVSIGLSYLSRTRLDNKNFGIHFAFQDRMGIGALLGASEKFSIGVHAVHYSNAHLAAYNSGMTMPLVLDIGYRFN